MEAKIDFLEVFLRWFSGMRFGIDLGLMFGGSKPEKSIKNISLSMFFASFQKIDVFEKSTKKPRFWNLFCGQNHEKSRKKGVENHVFF